MRNIINKIFNKNIDFKIFLRILRINSLILFLGFNLFDCNAKAIKSFPKEWNVVAVDHNYKRATSCGHMLLSVVRSEDHRGASHAPAIAEFPNIIRPGQTRPDFNWCFSSFPYFYLVARFIVSWRDASGKEEMLKISHEIEKEQNFK